MWREFGPPKKWLNYRIVKWQLRLKRGSENAVEGKSDSNWSDFWESLHLLLIAHWAAQQTNNQGWTVDTAWTEWVQKGETDESEEPESRPHSKIQSERRRQEIPAEETEAPWQFGFSSAFQIVSCHDWILRELRDLRQKAPGTKESEVEEPESFRNKRLIIPRGETENPRWAWIINPGADTLRNWWWRIRAQLDPGLGRRGCLPRRRQRLSAHKTQRLGDADQLRHGVSHRAASIIVWKTPLRRRHRQWQWRGLLWDFWGAAAAGWSWTATYAMIRSHQERSLRWT